MNKVFDYSALEGKRFTKYRKDPSVSAKTGLIFVGLYLVYFICIVGCIYLFPSLSTYAGPLLIVVPMLITVTYNLSLRKKTDASINTAWKKFARDNGCVVLGSSDSRYHWVTPSIIHNVRLRGMECRPVQYDIDGSSIVHGLYTRRTGNSTFSKGYYITSLTLYVDHDFPKMFVRLPGWRYYFMFSKTTLRKATKILNQTVYTEGSVIDVSAEMKLERCMRMLSGPYAIEFAPGTITFLRVGDYRDPRYHSATLDDILKFNAALY